MAQQGDHVDEERLCCSMCLDPVSDPVSDPCGYSYCRRCIDQHWTQVDQRGTFRCPQCAHTFIPTILVVNRNTMLAEVVQQSLKKTQVLPAQVVESLKKTQVLPAQVVESLKKTQVLPAEVVETQLPAVPPDLCYAGPGDVACDSCTGRTLKAVKTCLQCLVSYCDTHLQPHYQSPAFKKHKLVKASTTQLQENIICSHHDEVKKVFCRTDQQCICYLCSMDQHKGHDTISAATERTERQKELDARRQNIQHRIQQRERDVKVLQQEVESINHCADRAVEDSDNIFIELFFSIEIRQSEVRELIRDQQEREVSRTEEQRRRVEQEVTELRRRHAELEQISLTEDHIHFLHGFTSLPTISESTHPAGSHSPPLSLFDVSNIRVKTEDILKELGTLVSETVNRVDAFLSTTPPPPEPKTRAEFLQYSRPITLDPNTVEPHLSLSKGNRKVMRMMNKQSYPQHPERFTKCCQVLSGEALSGHCYWEVKWTGYNVYIAVSYKDISRTGLFNESGFGYNDKSWSLQCYDKEYVFRHRNVGTAIRGPVCSRVGVYLDHSAGLLSFYAVSDTMTLLHRVHTTFTHNLHPGFYVSSFIGATAELCDLK